LVAALAVSTRPWSFEKRRDPDIELTLVSEDWTPDVPLLANQDQRMGGQVGVTIPPELAKFGRF
jgi:hypothetical protein